MYRLTASFAATRPNSHSVRRDVEPGIFANSSRSCAPRMTWERVFSHSSPLRSKSGYGTSDIHALDTSVPGSPSVSLESAFVRNAVAGWWMSSR